MLAEETEKLTEVAGIGFQRLRRQPPLTAQMRKPVRHLKRDAGVGAVEFDRLNRGSWLCHLAVFRAVSVTRAILGAR